MTAMIIKIDKLKIKWYQTLFDFYSKLLARAIKKTHELVGTKAAEKWFKKSNKYLKTCDKLLHKRRLIIAKISLSFKKGR